VEQIEARFAELGAQLTDPAVIGDRARYLRWCYGGESCTRRSVLRLAA
jgi:hypothetical protein